MDPSLQEACTNALPMTPRTRNAMRLLGIAPEVIFQNDSFSASNIVRYEPTVIKIRPYQFRRQEKIDSILRERARLLDERMEITARSEASTVTSVRSQALEDITAREAKRIADFIHAQLRRKEYAEKVFMERLEKKEALRAKLEKVEKRVEQAEMLRDRKASEIREISQTRFQVRDQLLSLEKERREARVEEMKAKQAQQASNIEEFLKLKEEKQTAISELWEAKLREIADRASQQQEQMKQKGKEVLVKRRDKTRKVIESKAKILRLQRLKGEETTLKLLDALDRKRQLERQSSMKREQIEGFIQQDLEKAHLIELTKREILRKRKHLVSLRSRDSVSIDPLPLPGPTDYDLPDPESTTGGFISTTKPKLAIPGTIDFESTKDVPGPGHYAVDITDNPIMATWSSSKKTTFVEEINKAKSDLPGPASYDLPSPRNDQGVHLRRDLVPKEWLQKPDLHPGPGTYTVDDFTRNEAIRNKFDGGVDYTRKLLALPPVLEEMNEIDDDLLDI